MNHIDQETYDALKERMSSKFPILLSGYLEDAGTYLKTIKSSIPTGDLTPLIEAAHSLKSSSAILGLNNVSATAGHIEYAAKDMQQASETQLAPLLPLYENLWQSFENIKSFLQEELVNA